MSRNLLDQETSPYLLQHRTNPVHWRPWGVAALDEAQATDRPVLLSVGYAACHWCHVMAHESFEDEETAQLMNELFIPVKVDREERPDIDLIYQTALANLGQQGGWPLTMFLTPEGAPFWGGTYFPPTSRYGRPAFKDVLVGVANAYEKEPDKILTNVTALQAALTQSTPSGPAALPGDELLDQAAQALLQAIDPEAGGLNGAPKFPQAPLFAFLWRAARRSQDKNLNHAVTLTLDHICQGGIYDHLGGGFARYSTDPVWLVPHFEKMLYDNAQLIELLTSAWQATGSPLYKARIEETIAWLARDMMTEGDAFAATLDADSEGKEGKYYVWNDAEIDQLLPALREAFKRVYDVTAEGNWEGHTILHRNHPAGAWDAEAEADLAKARSILLEHRSHRVPPGRDDKILADWNGMMIAALAIAGFAFSRSDWIDRAERTFHFVQTRMTRGDRLAHSLRQSRLQAEAMLDDYAQMARAALFLHQVTGKGDYLDQTKHWVATVDAHYWDDTQGGYFFTADDAATLIVRTKSGLDQATPSGNGVMVEVLARLYHQTGDDSYRRRGEQVVRAFSSQIERSFPNMAALLNGWELLNAATTVVLVGRPQDLDDFTLVLAELCLPTLVLSRIGPDQALPPGHPAAAKQSLVPSDQAAAFICWGSVCSAPVFHPTELRAALTAR